MQKFKEEADISKLIFLDLDNTLIPTSWIMEFARRPSETAVLSISELNRRLADSGLFEALESLFKQLNNEPGINRVVIVTNAADTTVEGFYLMHCLPQLGPILNRYNIKIHSTSRWLEGGVPPPVYLEEDFREYYTNAKFLQFREDLKFFKQSLTHSESHLKHFPSSPYIDVVSVGDQLCEITAAIRLGRLNCDIVRQTRLLMILDGSGSRSGPPSPEIFVKKLRRSTDLLMLVLKSKITTVLKKVDMGCPEVVGRVVAVIPKGSNKVQNSWSESENVYQVPQFELDTASPDRSGQRTPEPTGMAQWISVPNGLAFCIGRPDQFANLQCCPPASWLNSFEKWCNFGKTQSAEESSALPSKRSGSKKNVYRLGHSRSAHEETSLEDFVENSKSNSKKLYESSGSTKGVTSAKDVDRAKFSCLQKRMSQIELGNHKISSKVGVSK